MRGRDDHPQERDDRHHRGGDQQQVERQLQHPMSDAALPRPAAGRLPAFGDDGAGGEVGHGFSFMTRNCTMAMIAVSSTSIHAMAEA